MYWLRKWLESYNNSTFSTWKNKWLFNMLIWIPNSFCTFHYYGRGGTPSLASPDGTSLIFIIQNFEQLALALKNRVCPEIFHCFEYAFHIQDFWTTCACPEIWLEIFQIHCIEIFYIVQDFWATCACPDNRICPEIFHCIEYTFCIQDFWAIRACREKQSLPWIHCIEYIFFMFQNFEQLSLSLKTEFAQKVFTVLNILCRLHSVFLSNLRLPWKTECALKFFTVLKYVLSFMIF